MSFSYYSPVTIDHTKVPSTQTDFPVLVSVTDARLKTVANGGHVQSSSGYDIRPYSDSGLTTALTYEIESYDATTGAVVLWVKIASLSSSVDTVIYLGYGDAALTTNGSSTATWSNSFISVYHLGNGTTLSVTDSVGANNGTAVNTPTAGAGQIDGCGSFASASTQYVNLGTGINPTAITYSAWVKGTSFPAAYNSVIVRHNGTQFCLIRIKSTGKMNVAFVSGGGNINYDGTGTFTLSTATWYYVSAVFDNVAGCKGYVNAALDANPGTPGTLNTTAAQTSIGRDPNTAGREWNGLIDEVRISSVARSVDWMTAEYNNQNAPGTFITFGTEVPLTTNVTVNLTGVSASPAIGTGTINNIGTFNPASVGGLTVWLKADSLLVSNGGAVSPWTDMSGGGNDGVIVGTPAPTVRANALKGLPVVRFTTSEGRVRGVNGIAGSGLPAPAYNYTVIYVTRTVGPTVGRVFSALYPETNFLVGFHSSGMDTAYDGSAFLITATAYGTLPTLWKLYTMTGAHDGVTATDAFYKDGALLAGSGGGTGLQFHYNLSGYDATATLETCDCEVAELLIYNHALSTADLAAVWKYLGDKWFNVLLTGVAANPQVGAGTLAIEVVAPPAGELVAGGIRRGWVEDETEYLTGVAAQPEIGTVTPIARGTLEDLAAMFPFPRQAEKRPLPQLVPRRKAARVPVFVYMVGVNPMPRVGTGKVNAFYEEIDEEVIAMIDLL